MGMKKEIKKAIKKGKKHQRKFETTKLVSTGSTLLDLAITGVEKYKKLGYGGIPKSTLTEIFGPSGCGKTTLMCNIAGNIQRFGGDILFKDPEGRLNTEFAKIFGAALDFKKEMPDTIQDVFDAAKKWEPEPENNDAINGIFADSLTALESSAEHMKGEDKMGMARAKDFSSELRKYVRYLAKSDTIFVVSNQIRQGKYGPIVPGGEAVKFYSSLRLRYTDTKPLEKQKKINGQTYKKVTGVVSNIKIVKSTVGKPFRDALIYIVFDYGIDDIQGNLVFLRKSPKEYILGKKKIATNVTNAIKYIEKHDLEKDLQNEVVKKWDQIEKAFEMRRKGKY